MVVGTLGSVPDPTEINGIAASGRGPTGRCIASRKTWPMMAF